FGWARNIPQVWFDFHNQWRSVLTALKLAGILLDLLGARFQGLILLRDLGRLDPGRRQHARQLLDRLWQSLGWLTGRSCGRLLCSPLIERRRNACRGARRGARMLRFP